MHHTANRVFIVIPPRLRDFRWNCAAFAVNQGVGNTLLENGVN